MASAAGLVLAAGGIAVANEVIFTPMEAGKGVDLQSFNWRIVPATAILALTLTGLEKISEPLGVGLAGLTLLAVLILPVGKAPTPIDNLARLVETRRI
jgi:hypothetical protein